MEIRLLYDSKVTNSPEEIQGYFFGAPIYGFTIVTEVSVLRLAS